MADNADTKTLAELREAYDAEDHHEDGAFSHDDMNAFHRAARALIAALEQQNAEQQRRITELEAWLERVEQLARLHEREWIDKVNAQTSRVARQPLIHIQWGQLASIVADLLHADENGGEG